VIVAALAVHRKTRKKEHRRQRDRRRYGYSHGQDAAFLRNAGGLSPPVLRELRREKS
jgi:hypothetical protein